MTILADQLRDRVASLLSQQVADGGYRLGIIAERGDSDAEAHAETLLTAAGLSPERRLARLGPRYGETEMRAEDMADFGRRYGHEYVAAVFRRETFRSDADRHLIEAAFRGEGCEVAWH